MTVTGGVERTKPTLRPKKRQAMSDEEAIQRLRDAVDQGDPETRYTLLSKVGSGYVVFASFTTSVHSKYIINKIRSPNGYI